MNKKSIEKFILRSLTALVLTTQLFFSVNAADGNQNTEVTLIVLSNSTVSPELLAQRIKLVTGDSPIYMYDQFGGFSVNSKIENIYKIQAVNGVAEVYESHSYQKSSVQSLSGGDEINNIVTSRNNIESELRGEGTVVAILDNGFDVSHKIFRLSNDTQTAISEDYESDIESSLSISNYESYSSRNAYVSRKIPFAFDYADYDFDVSSNDNHGTHVAGIIAANNLKGYSDGFDGIAPEAQLLLMKVSSDSSNYMDDYAIIAAINDSIKLGADVINLSFGETAGSLTNLEGIDYSSLFKIAVNSGTSVYAAAGNEYKTGKGSGYYDNYGITSPLTSSPDYSTINSPSSYENAMSVASSGNPSVVLSKYLKVGDQLVSYVNDSEGRFSTEMKSKTFEYIVIPGYGEEDDYKGLDANGKIAVIRRGELTFIDKLNNAEKAGAVGAIIWNNNPGEGYITMMVESGQIPAAMIQYESASTLIDNDNGSLTVVNRKPVSKDSSDTGISTYSSWGATELLNLKPDVTGIGGEVYSSINNGEFANMSGTSMATPYLSGIDALMHQALREGMLGDAQFGATDKVTRIRNLITSSAVPLIEEESGVEYSPRAQGAGLADADLALGCQTIVTSNKTGLCKIELYDKLSNEFKLYINIKNLSNESKTYTIAATSQTDGYEYVSEAGEYFTTDIPTVLRKTAIKLDNGNDELNKYSSVYANGTAITVGGKSEKDIVLIVKLSKNEISELKKIFTNGMFIEGFVYFTETENGNDAVSIPYMGFLGDWGAIPVFDDSGEYFATRLITYIESVPDNINMTLGVNGFTSDEIYSKKTAAISPNGDGCADTLGLALGLTRNVGAMSAEIYSKAGELIYSVDGDYGWKKCIYDDTLYISGLSYDIWDVSDPGNSKVTLPDGEYYMVVKAYSVYDSKTPQTLRLDFAVDTIFPTLEGYSVIEDNGKRYLDVDTSDDRYIQCIRAYEGLEKSLYEDFYNNPDDYDLYDSYATYDSDKAKGQASARFDITEYTGDYIYVDIIDFACNLKTVKINLD